MTRFAGRLEWLTVLTVLNAARENRPANRKGIPRSRDWTPGDIDTAIDSLEKVVSEGNVKRQRCIDHLDGGVQKKFCRSLARGDHDGKDNDGSHAQATTSKRDYDDERFQKLEQDHDQDQKAYNQSNDDIDDAYGYRGGDDGYQNNRDAHTHNISRHVQNDSNDLFQDFGSSKGKLTTMHEALGGNDGGVCANLTISGAKYPFEWAAHRE